MTISTIILILTSLHIVSSNTARTIELKSKTINSSSNSASTLALLITNKIKENGFVFVNDSSIGNKITVDTKTDTITGLEGLSNLVGNISKFYMDDDLLTENTEFTYTLGNVAGRGEIARGINKVSGAPKQVLVTGHSEASYLPHSPLYLIFACPGLPDLTYGGQTTVYPIDKIVDKLMETTLGRNLLDDVAKYGVIYIRNDPHINNSKHALIWNAVNYPVWQHRFAGKTQKEISDMLTGSKQNVTWIVHTDETGNTYDTLHTEWKMPGFRLHPRTGKIVWFNQLYAMNGRYFNGHNVGGMDGLNLNDRPLNTLVGNGRELTDEEYDLLGNIHDELQVLIPWDNTGDILAIDNFAYQHGRMPYDSYRSCVINWGYGVEGGEYIYNSSDFQVDMVKDDIKAVYKLVDEFKWYDTVLEQVFYRDENGKVLSGLNCEEISMSSIPVLYRNIFEYRHDINVILHVNNPDIAAIGMSKYSFLPIDQSYYMLVPVRKSMNINANLSSILGMDSRLLLMKNNGMIVLGSKFEEVFTRFFYAVRAAESQILALSVHKGNINNIIFPSEEIQAITTQQSLNFNSDGYGHLEFIAWKRRYNLDVKKQRKIELEPSVFDIEEEKLRRDITKAYHILDRFGWTETIYQHITGILPSNNNIMLINAYGLEFGEVTINNLMKVSMNGTVIYGGDSIRGGYINPSGLALHAAVHDHAGTDAKIVIHCHHSAISAISVYKHGLLSSMINDNYKGLIGNVGYHDFDSLSLAINKTVLSEKLSNGSNVIILRNHGILTIGENVQDAFNRLYYTIQAAETQIKSMLSNNFHHQQQQENTDTKSCELDSNYYNVWNSF